MVSLDALRVVPIFAGLGEDDLEKIIPLCHEEVHGDETKLFDEGSQARVLYVIEEGKVAIEVDFHVSRGMSPHPITVTEARANEIFGWSALVSPHHMTASARCMGRTKLIAIDGPKLNELLEQDPRLGLTVMRNVAQLIRARLLSTRASLVSKEGLDLLYHLYSY